MMKKAVWVGLAMAIFCVLGSAHWAKAADEAKAPAGGAPAVAAAATPDGGLAVEGGEAAAAPKHGEGGFLEIITRAGWFGMVIWAALIICSIISVALIVDSFVNIKDVKIMPPDLIANVRSSMEQGDLLKAIGHCDSSPGALANILKAGFAQVEEGYEVVQDAVGVAADLESEKLLSRVTYLSVISNTTPMLGLIGTVQGMIMAFYTMGTMEAGAAQQSMLAVNISHGLWATAIGLGTAVPATIFFYFFKNRAMNSILRMEALTLDLIKALRNVEVVSE
ncbi:MAG: MotA/TolQ/ExbB proton channel family protein [bacterium]|jgi:biopolymer transport protein ExbB